MSTTVLIVIVALCVVVALGYFFLVRETPKVRQQNPVKPIPSVYPATSSQQWPENASKDHSENLGRGLEEGAVPDQQAGEEIQRENGQDEELELPEEKFLPIEATTVSSGTDQAGLPLHDPLLQELIKITFAKPVVGNQLVEYVRQAKVLVPEGHLKVLAYEINSKSWLEPDPIGLYSEVAFYVQLASTKGAMNEVSLSELYQLFNRMEMSFSADMTAEDVNVVSERSKKLADMVVGFGLQITLWLLPHETVTIDRFEQVSSDLGFRRRSSHTYEKIGDFLSGPNGEAIYQKGIFQINWLNDKKIALSLNVPLIAPEENPLRLFMMAANAFGAVFDAEIVDASGTEINGGTIALVEKELKVFYRQMREAQIEPGSLRAHCLLD